MTNENLNKARKRCIAALKSADETSAYLSVLLNETENEVPSLYSPYEPDIGMSPLDPNKLNWSAKYFSRHIALAEHNFARDRIEHLLEVREHLRNQGVKGFVPRRKDYAPPRNAAADYAPSANLETFLKEGDLLTLRTALRMELDDNRLSGADLRDALNWVKSKKADLLETFSDQAYAQSMDTDAEHWTSSYYERQVVYLKTNFAEERFLHLIDVREHLRKNGVEGFIATPQEGSANTTARPISTSQRQPHQSEDPLKQSNKQSILPENNPVFKAAFLVGGALAALVVFLVTLVK